MCYRALKIKLAGIATIAYQCPLNSIKWLSKGESVSKVPKTMFRYERPFLKVILGRFGTTWFADL